MTSEVLFGPKTSLQVLFQSWHCDRSFICFMSTRMEIGVHWHWLFHTQIHVLCEGIAHTSQSEFHFAFNLDSIQPGNECVATALKICPFLGLCSFFYAQIVKFMRAWVCTDNMHVSCLQAKGWQHHLSQTLV